MHIGKNNDQGLFTYEDLCLRNSHEERQDQ